MKDLNRHSKYIGNDPHLNKNFPRFMRPMKRKISKLLEGIDFTERHGVDYHLSKARPMNKPGFLANFLKTHDNAQIYLTEAESKTIPTKDFVDQFVKFCDEKLPKELSKVKFEQLYRDNDKNAVVSSPPVIMDEDQVVSPMICLALPTYNDSVLTVNTLIKEFIDIAADDGYFLAYKPDIVECRHHDGLPKNAMISYLTFEAKYMALDIDLNGNLFHVTTEKALKDIAVNGLVPKSESQEFSYPPRIYLFNKTDYDSILAYGKDKLRKSGEKNFYVLRIDKSSIENYPAYKSYDFMLYRDPCFSDDQNKTDETAIFTYDKIPLSLINSTVARYNIDLNEPTMMKLEDFK